MTGKRRPRFTRPFPLNQAAVIVAGALESARWRGPGVVSPSVKRPDARRKAVSPFPSQEEPSLDVPEDRWGE
jgi:hypothetical protein